MITRIDLLNRLKRRFTPRACSKGLYLDGFCLIVSKVKAQSAHTSYRISKAGHGPPFFISLSDFFSDGRHPEREAEGSAVAIVLAFAARD
jgi:hypothetical protein